MQTLTLFVSSPGDVRDERQAVGRIVERLQARYWNFVRLEPVLWEKEPLRATAHFNEELTRPSDCDLFVCVLWSRLGSPLPSQFNRADGTRFDSGTEWELEEATEAYEKRAGEKAGQARPDILAYRRMSDPPAGPEEGKEARKAQKKSLDAFCKRFFFNEDGTIRRAFSPYETVDEFSTLLEQHLEKLVLRHIRLQRGLAEEAVRPLPVEGSPFKGLGAFSFEDAALFFGRNRAIAEGLEQLKRNREAGHAFLLIYGGSGYGKSSLMRAGLAPRLTADGYLPDTGAWRRATLLPGENGSPALETLARAMVAALPELTAMRDSWDSARLTRMLGQPESLALTLAAILGALDRVSAARPAQLLVMIDQLEEIFTAPAVTAGERDAFFNLLAALAMTRRIWVVATMRSEFFPRVPEHKDLFRLVRHGGGYILAPPELPELLQMIRYPALAAGLQFERHSEHGRDLSEQIYQDASGAADALPLLEFTLEELYQRRQENLLTWAAYEELGGLAGAIARRAQETYEALESETRREAGRHLFGELVSIDPLKSGLATRRRVRRELLENAHPGAPGFLEAFIGAKLLVTGSEDGAATVTLAHEALITHWPVLHEWIHNHRDLLLARRRLEDAARLWLESGKATKLLLSEGRLAEAQRVRECGVFRLSAEEEELVTLSGQKAKRQLRVFQSATVVFAVLAVGAGTLGWLARQRGKVSEERRIQALGAEQATRRSLAAADFDAGAAKAEAGSPDEALPYLLSALEGDPGNLDAQALLLGTLRRTGWHVPVQQLAHPLGIRKLTFSPDGRLLYAATDSSSSAEGFNTTLRWDLSQETITAMLKPVWGQGNKTLTISPDGQHVVIQRGYKAADMTLLCDAETMRIKGQLGIARSQSTPSTCFSWSPDGLLLAYLAVDDSGQPVWRISDVATGAPVRDSEPLMPDGPQWLASSLDRNALRAVAADGSVLEIPLNPSLPTRTGNLPGGPGEPVDFAVFSPDGGKILAALPADQGGSRHVVASVADSTTSGRLEVTPLLLEDETAWTNGAALMARFPWAKEDAPFWDRLMSKALPGELLNPVTVKGTRLDVSLGSYPVVEDKAPVRADSQIESVATTGDLLAVGESSGMLTLHTWLPLLETPPESAPSPAAQEPTEQESDGGWTNIRTTAAGELQRRGNDWRLKQGEKIINLQAHAAWDYVTGVAVNHSGTRVVVCGYSSGSGGYSSAGMIAINPETGEALSDIEPVAEIRGIDFLGDQDRIAATGSTEVIVAEVEADGFRKLASIPVVDAVGLKYLEGRRALAVATAEEIDLFDPESFARLVSLPISGGISGNGWDENFSSWAEDAEHGWLAYARDGVVRVWATGSGRSITPPLPTAKQPGRISFGRHGDLTGLICEPGGFYALAKADGVSAVELAQLKKTAEALAGTKFAKGSRALQFSTLAERKQAAQEVNADALSTLLPKETLKAATGRVAAVELRQASPEAWLGVWEALAFSGYQDPDQIARWSAALGTGNRWYQSYLRGLIGESDQRLYAAIRENDGSPLAEDTGVANLQRLAGDSATERNLKQAAWLVAATEPARVGTVLADETKENFPDFDADTLRRQDPAAVAALKKALEESATLGDATLLLLTSLERRESALKQLDDRISATKAAYEAEPSVNSAIAHAEALSLRGDLPGAAAFLQGKTGVEDTTLSLKQLHFLIAAGLLQEAGPAVEKELKTLNSPWLWNAYLDELVREDPEKLPTRIEEIMVQQNGRGPVAVHALQVALRSENAEAIAAVMRHAQEMPMALRQYAAAQSLWVEGKKAEVFSLWPQQYPDLESLAEASEWNGWEQAVAWDETSHFFTQLDAELETLKIAADAPVEDMRTLAARLLAPETAATFGMRHVRKAMIELALNLAYDRDSEETVLQLVDRARMAGEDPVLCLRAEARALLAVGDSTSAYARWLQILDQPENGLISTDYLEAAQCLLLDLQEEPAVALLLKGRGVFSGDSSYAYQAAWTLLNSLRPREAELMLEHGFQIPFAADQVQLATAMLVCTTEQRQDKEAADHAFSDLIQLDPRWKDPAQVQQLDWPEALKQTLIAVIARNLEPGKGKK